jgi:PAS domain-containing protein
MLSYFNESCVRLLGWEAEEWLGKDRLGERAEDTWYWYDKDGNAYSEEELDFTNNKELLSYFMSKITITKLV